MAHQEHPRDERPRDHDSAPADESAHAHDDETLRERFFEAAIEAELETGAAEETAAEARAGVIKRLARMSVGFTLALAGLAMMVLPGPGLVVLAAGLAILSRDFVWAERTVGIVRSRLPQDEDGQVPTRVWVMMGVTCTVGIGASLWWTMLR